MTHHHLSEEDVQLVAMQESAGLDPSWQGCPHCEARVEAYRMIFASVSRLAPEMPGFDLEAAVMARLPEPIKPVKAVSRSMYAMPIWIGSFAFLAVLVGIATSLWEYFPILENWMTGLVLVTVPGTALWLLIDAIQDHRKKLRSIGLS